ncbi:hypothetical protein NLX85_17945 [Micromonospora sp. A3M-1-15]|uniref:hypothetical protein n=1 Tax=Micromonospora sp. A3M-1-15 TaxID=2962035 RepID=UPI0020B78B20|nr:hypothetical protein [Micromonospora sp. A3M-1-15]MCP3785251.1 hypothetical protein [Micromonospora sp. A3M-1-15]
MTTPETTTSPPTLESVLLDAWNMFHPGQPAPLGWLTHTTAQIHAHLHSPHTPPQAQPHTADPYALARFRREVWRSLREAASTHDIDADAADRVLSALDLPALPRRWQVRLTLPILIEVTATGREDAFDTAEAAAETALNAAEVGARIEWDGSERDDADPGDLDPAVDEPAELG